MIRLKNKPLLLKEWDYSKNDKDPLKISINSHYKAWWKCRKCKNEWEAEVRNRANRNNNCKKCKSIAASHPLLAKDWHPEKNDKLTSDNITAGSGKKVWWICKKGHEWQEKICNRKNGCGCPYCSGNRCNLDNCLLTTHPEIIKEWHSKNSIKTDEIQAGSNYKAWWICEKGHEWKAIVNNRTKKKNKCPYCSGRFATKETCLLATHPELAKEWSFKNTKTPTEVSHGSRYRASWKCSTCSYEWESIINSRTKGHGCPKCNESSGEKAIAEILDKYKVIYKREYKINECKNERVLPFDFAIFNNNKRLGLIEFQGIQHYKPISTFGGTKRYKLTKKTDSIKCDFCKDKNIPLLCVPYNAKIDQLLGKFLRSINALYS